MNVAYDRAGRRRRGNPLAMFLALLSSTGSIAIAGVGGWQRGTMQIDQVLFAGVAILAALAAQFLPTLAGRLASAKRMACLGIWLACMGSTALAHAWYLLAAQERTGTARVEALMRSQAAPAPSVRERSAILSDRAGVSEQLAWITARVCEGVCADRQRFRKAALADRLAALDAEAQATADVRQSRFQLQEQLQKVKEDLVGGKLASSLGVSYSTATWVIALTYALILEGVGCLCWAVVLHVEVTPALLSAEDRSPAIEAPLTPGAASVLKTDLGSNDFEATPVSESPQSNDTLAERLIPRSQSQSLLDDIGLVTAAVRDSTIKLTVAEVRRFLHCGQTYAQKIRRLVAVVPTSPL